MLNFLFSRGRTAEGDKSRGDEYEFPSNTQDGGDLRPGDPDDEGAYADAPAHLADLPPGCATALEALLLYDQGAVIERNHACSLRVGVWPSRPGSRRVGAISLVHSLCR